MIDLSAATKVQHPLGASLSKTWPAALSQTEKSRLISKTSTFSGINLGAFFIEESKTPPHSQNCFPGLFFFPANILKYLQTTFLRKPLNKKAANSVASSHSLS